ncbi:hypothetical protein LNJ03_07385 [Tenacibaculum dicentrarchi]|nr:hypothetical protein [Tenacibaculum dicentrarchi]
MDDCIEISNDKIIVFKDPGNNKCEMRFLNPSQLEVSKIRVDGCKITDGKKCDFMLLANKTENYIEIKGKHVTYACEQIEATINKLSNDIKKCVKNSFVVSTGSPNVSGKVQILKKKFKKSYNSTLKIQTRKCEHRI